MVPPQQLSVMETETALWFWIGVNFIGYWGQCCPCPRQGGSHVHDSVEDDSYVLSMAVVAMRCMQSTTLSPESPPMAQLPVGQLSIRGWNLDLMGSFGRPGSLLSLILVLTQ